MRLVTGMQHELVFEDQRAVAVEVGGGIRQYSVGRREILDGYEADEVCPGGAGQILAPWPNRIEGGWYDFAGTGYQLPVNELATGTAIHGLTRWISWNKLDGDPSRVRLGCLLNARPGYPFSLELSVAWELGPAGLRVVHQATNIGAHPCPFGLGIHPYLRAPTGAVDDLVLTVPASAEEEVDRNDIPVRTVAVEGTALDFRSGQRIGARAIDRCYSALAATSNGRGERVEVDLASGGEPFARLWFQPPFQHVQIFTGDTLPAPRRRRALAVEPLTCPANAFRTGQDLITLPPGGTVEAIWGIQPAR
jgi:aldose 1-epimerase